ncbi:MAG TPA: acyl-CoA dehydrogenase family protein [Ilumatobacteraceae bacterium]|nr:acyl-CoA dehydrogenase family protein [Ilumatobacteraceae bacterium]
MNFNSGSGLDRETLDMILDSITEFARRELPDSALIDLDQRDEFPADVILKMCSSELGVQLLFIAEEYGGMGGGAFDIYRVCERMARIDVGVATAVLATFLGSDPITVGGTPEQKKQWMSRIAEEGLLMAYGATEPEAGSDLGALKTVATPMIEDGVVVGYSITGQKQWISNGGVADLYSILAKAPGGPTWFVLEKGLQGFEHGEHENKHGIRLSNTAALFLDEVKVEADRLVGGVEGQGLVQAQQVFGYTRLMVAAFGLGAGWAALDRAIPYSVERIQAGSPLSQKQGYTHKLIVPNVVRLEAARAYIEETAEHIDSDTALFNTEGAIAKYMATEAGNAAADAAIQALGGYGYVHEYMVEKIKRDVRITTIYEGTSEIMEMTIGRDRWQEHLKTSGRYYHDQAVALEALHQADPTVGADVAALAHHALAEVMEACRAARLTRNQHVLLRLGEWVAWTECSAGLSRRAARAAATGLPDKGDQRFDAAALAAMSRVFARDAALKVTTEGLRWLHGGTADLEPGLDERVGLTQVMAAQSGLIDDMNAVAAAVYGRDS